MKRVLPGFGLSLGFTLVYLSLLILLPLSGLAFKASSLSFEQFWNVATGERALAAYRVTFGASLAAALINAFFGLIVAWVLVRYPFPGKRLVDSLVDLPFALPTNDYPSTYVDSAGQPVSTYVATAEAARKAQAVAETAPVERAVPIAVTRLRTMNTVTREPNPYVLVQGTDFDVVNGRIDWALGDARGTAPVLDQLFTITYNYNPVYQVITFSHAARDQMLPSLTCGDPSAEILTRFPVEVLVKLEALIEGVPGD